MAAKRKQKLKVYCTPVGFHDAYVAAPSQKAALEAWGAKTNLFGQGSAHQVTDAALTKAPLDHPGEVIKVLRGSDAEQVAALERTASSKRAKRQTRPAPEAEPMKAPRGPKPSRAKLNKAEDALEVLQSRQAKRLRQIDESRSGSTASGASSGRNRLTSSLQRKGALIANANNTTAPSEGGRKAREAFGIIRFGLGSICK